ncbi:DUF2523 domain-containing protein [Methyloversatilis sp. NSM2]|uniref:DUF2523 domain-containing protein n=1 Tax=Methyloversatilis sp. NSM2 TaxID=3134135 RepID=UPI00311365F1
MALPFLLPLTIGGWLLLAVNSLVGRVLIGLGLGLVTYNALDPLLNELRDRFFSELYGVPADVLGFVGLLKIGEAVQIIFAALVTKLFTVAAQGAIKRWVVK